MTERVFDGEEFADGPPIRLDAWIVGGRWKHHRVRDHFGSESDLDVSLEGPLGQWLQGTPIHYVLEDLWNRTQALEDSYHFVSGFTLDAWFGMYFTAYAVIAGVSAGSFTLRAWLVGGASFSLDAVLEGRGSFSLNAVIL